MECQTADERQKFVGKAIKSPSLQNIEITNLYFLKRELGSRVGLLTKCIILFELTCSVLQRNQEAWLKPVVKSLNSRAKVLLQLQISVMTRNLLSVVPQELFLARTIHSLFATTILNILNSKSLRQKQRQESSTDIVFIIV